MMEVYESVIKKINDIEEQKPKLDPNIQNMMNIFSTIAIASYPYEPTPSEEVASVIEVLKNSIPITEEEKKCFENCQENPDAENMETVLKIILNSKVGDECIKKYELDKIFPVAYKR